MKKKIEKRKILLIVIYLIAIRLLFLPDMINNNFIIGMILSVVWVPVNIFFHELGHAIVLRVFEKKSCICFRKFIGKKVRKIHFFKIDVYFVNEKGYGMMALSISEFLDLNIRQVKIASIAGFISDVILLVVTTIIAIKCNILALLLFPLLFTLIYINEFLFGRYGNDFWIFNNPSEFQDEIKGVLKGIITDEKIIDNYKYRIYSKLITKIDVNNEVS